MNHIERLITKRQPQTVRHDEPRPRILVAQKRRVIDSDRRNHILVRIPSLQIVRGLVAAVRRDADIEDAFFGRNPRIQHEPAEHLAALVRRNSDRQAPGRGDIVLGVGLNSWHDAALTALKIARLAL